MIECQDLLRRLYDAALDVAATADQDLEWAHLQTIMGEVESALGLVDEGGQPTDRHPTRRSHVIEPAWLASLRGDMDYYGPAAHTIIIPKRLFDWLVVLCGDMASELGAAVADEGALSAEAGDATEDLLARWENGPVLR